MADPWRGYTLPESGHARCFDVAACALAAGQRPALPLWPMDLISGKPYWPIKNGLLATYPPLERSVSCDVAVIGGGITGACVAYELTRAGLDVVVVDRRDIGRGSTSGSTNLVLYEIDLMLGELCDLLGEPSAARCYQLSADAVEY